MKVEFIKFNDVRLFERARTQAIKNVQLICTSQTQDEITYAQVVPITSRTQVQTCANGSMLTCIFSQKKEKI